MKVFIADNSLLVRQRLASQLAELKGVDLAGEAEETNGAVEAIRELRPDVVILDLKMPGGGGIEVLEAIKATPDAPFVIVFTAFPYPQYRTRCLEVGADCFLDKTTDFEEISRVLCRFRDGCGGGTSGGAEGECRRPISMYENREVPKRRNGGSDP